MIVKILLSGLILVHGLIHLLGFVKGCNRAPVKELTGRTLIPLSAPSLKVVGALWLVSALMLVIIAVLVMLKQPWWIMAVPALAISQLMIVLYWHDARYGTIANVIILIATILTWSSVNFQQMVGREITALQEHAQRDEKRVSREMCEHLPICVQRWLDRSQVIDRNWIPTRSTVSWKLTTGDFTWYKLEISEVVYNDRPGK